MAQKITISALFFVLASLCHSCIQSSIGGGGLGLSSHKIELNSVGELYRFLTYDEKRYPLVSAHRGGPAIGFPENAIETFENSTRKQPVIIECDIRMTKDSVLILMHDESLDRTTDASGRINQKRHAELKNVRLKDVEGTVTPYHIPTLDEALQWGAGKVIFTLDVKRGVPYDLVVDAIRRNNAEAYSVVITYSADQAQEVHDQAPELMISASIRSAEDLFRLNDRNIPDNILVAFVGTSEVDQQVYELLHGHGIMCILGTMGNLDQQASTSGGQVYMELVNRGADILSTDRPKEAGEALRRYRIQHKLTSAYVN